MSTVETISRTRTIDGRYANQDDPTAITTVVLPGFKVGYRVGANGRIYADHDAAARYAANLKAKMDRIAARRVEATIEPVAPVAAPEQAPKPILCRASEWCYDVMSHPERWTEQARREAFDLMMCDNLIGVEIDIVPYQAPSAA